MLRVRTIFACVALIAVAAMAGCDKKEGLRITGIDPKTGAAGGGDQVTIMGSGFEQGGAKGVDVWFGDRKGRVLHIKGDDKILVVPPANDAGKVVDVILQFDDARGYTYKDAYTYIEPGSIKVDDLLKKPGQ